MRAMPSICLLISLAARALRLVSSSVCIGCSCGSPLASSSSTFLVGDGVGLSRGGGGGGAIVDGDCGGVVKGLC